MMRQLMWLVLWISCSSAWGSDEAALREIKTVLWPKAYKTQDVELLDTILHPTFEMIDADGVRSNREKELDFVANHQWNPGEFEYVIERLQIYQGRFAIVDGTGNAERYTYKSSNVFIKEAGEWKAIASHVSGYQEKPRD